jgi:broad specificity phosphatase PhoE
MIPRTILCIRHDQSTFNAAFEERGIDPMLFDARLTPKGGAQVLAARETMRDVPSDLVVTSPLSRALQTAFDIFEGHFSNPRFVVEALHRERAEGSCDVGRPPSALRKDYPTLRLDHVPEVWWHDDDGDVNALGLRTEPLGTMMQRIAHFRDFFSGLPEPRIAVVGHGTFFYHLTGTFLPNCGMIELEMETA